MRWLSCSTALAAAIVFTSAQADAGSYRLPAVAGASAFIIPVGGCHRSERTHYVEEVGRSLAHVHIGEDCDPYRLSDSDSDDDDDDDDDDYTVYEPDDDFVCIEIGDLDICP
jgi:hypothetical protein